MMENNPIIARPIIDFEQQPHVAENGKIPYAAARDTYQNKVSKADDILLDPFPYVSIS